MRESEAGEAEKHGQDRGAHGTRIQCRQQQPGTAECREEKGDVADVEETDQDMTRLGRVRAAVCVPAEIADIPAITTVLPAAERREQQQADTQDGGREISGGPGVLLFREGLRWIPERLELERVARRVAEKHGGLLADLPDEADPRLDDERYSRGAQTIRQRVPGLPREDDPEVPDRDRVPIHLIRLPATELVGGQVRHDLVAVEIEVDPLVGRASFGAAEQLPVETACGLEVVDGEGEVEGRDLGHGGTWVWG